jgi:hypothetical protein
VARGKTKVHNKYQFVFYFNKHLSYVKRKGHRGHDRMVVPHLLLNKNQENPLLLFYQLQICDVPSKGNQVSDRASTQCIKPGFNLGNH